MELARLKVINPELHQLIYRVKTIHAITGGQSKVTVKAEGFDGQYSALVLRVTDFEKVRCLHVLLQRPPTLTIQWPSLGLLCPWVTVLFLVSLLC